MQRHLRVPFVLMACVAFYILGASIAYAAECSLEVCTAIGLTACDIGPTNVHWDDKEDDDPNDGECYGSCICGSGCGGPDVFVGVCAQDPGEGGGPPAQ